MGSMLLAVIYLIFISLWLPDSLPFSVLCRIMSALKHSSHRSLSRCQNFVSSPPALQATSTRLMVMAPWLNRPYMTKGHFHEILMTAEVYYCLEGEGGMLIESQEGDTRFLPMTPGKLVYVPKGYAHRTINTGATPLSSLFVYRADTGHDYKTIETKGFRKNVVRENGEMRLRNNPFWS